MTKDVPETNWIPLIFPCPECGALPWCPCTEPGDRKPAGVHEARVDALFGNPVKVLQEASRRMTEFGFDDLEERLDFLRRMLKSGALRSDATQITRRN